MGAPKQNYGSETTPQMSKAHPHPFKSSPISILPKDPHQRKRNTFQALCLLFLPPLLHLNINSFMDLGLHAILLDIVPIFLNCLHLGIIIPSNLTSTSLLLC